jgi:hypothetical protein
VCRWPCSVSCEGKPTTNPGAKLHRASLSVYLSVCPSVCLPARPSVRPSNVAQGQAVLRFVAEMNRTLLVPFGGPAHAAGHSDPVWRLDILSCSSRFASSTFLVLAPK